MTEELLFTVDGTTAVPAQPITLAEAGLLERKHLQQWVIDHPQLIGDGIKVVTFEYGRWVSTTGSTADRLDVLGLDRAGRLVVIELKRDRAPDTVTMQAINYAAMASRFTLDLLAEVHAAHLGSAVTSQQALSDLMGWAEGLSDETLGLPRIVLMASDFGPAVTNTALYLYEAGIDIRLVRYQLYRTASGEKVLSVAQLIPVPDAEEFMVRPRSSSGTQAASRASGARKAAAVQRLVAHHAIADGTPLTIVVPDLVDQDRDAIRGWLDEDPNRARVRWCNDVNSPVEWSADGQAYRLIELIRRIIDAATGQPPRAQLWAQNWYRNDEGQTLHQLAEPLP
ncbi:endonuclease NucS [Micromonospora sp. NIE79]|uniref:Endonuclease NucS n=1 Tax=Micromonospora trifolii TaxID=2911208 RepID=A0ABS9N866_9ACTN|nr:endonuclease NucS domain-containing protein [Micromonospora trifolii]MCG5446141.1 endonuclease NucS [Micromonospora trifolii]